MKRVAFMLALAAIVALASAGAGTAGAGTVGASPLRWSAPTLVDHAPPFGGLTRIQSISCPTAAFCLGVGRNGTVVTATGGAAPKVVETGVESDADLNSVSCPTVSLCVATSLTPSLLITTDPTAPTPTWRIASGPPAGTPGDPPGYAIDCPTASSCALLALGSVWTSSDPAGGPSSWTRELQPVGPHGFSALACAPGGGLCVALANTSMPRERSGLVVATTTDPAGGPGAWEQTSAPVDPGLSGPPFLMDEVTCPSVALCVATQGDAVLSSADPAAGGSSWISTPITPVPTSNQGPTVGVACGSPSPSSCLVALTDGSVLIGSGSAMAPTWTRSQVLLDPNRSDDPELDGFPVACRPGPGVSCLVFVHGSLAQIVASGAAAPSKSVTSLLGLTKITGLSCPSAAFCAGVDNAGAVLWTTGPEGPAAGWHRVVQRLASVGLNAISCPDTSFCAAVGGGGRLLTSSSPTTARAWKGVKLDHVFRRQSGPFGLTTIACASKGLCVASGDEARRYRLLVSTRPAGGPRAWKIATAPPIPYTSLSCTNTKLCIAGSPLPGGLVVSKDPSRSWKRLKLPDTDGGQRYAPILAVACTPSGLCLAGDRDGQLFASKNPTGGVKTFTRVRLSDQPIGHVACQSANLCVATDASGRAWVSTTPAGPASTWHPTKLASPPSDQPLVQGLTALACAPKAVCLAGNFTGDVFAGS